MLSSQKKNKKKREEAFLNGKEVQRSMATELKQ